LNPAINFTVSFDVAHPELDLLLIYLDQESDSNRTIGYYCIGVDSIRTGYRILPLKSRSGAVLKKCDLLIHTTLSEPRTEKRVEFLRSLDSEYKFEKKKSEAYVGTKITKELNKIKASKEKKKK